MVQSVELMCKEVGQAATAKQGEARSVDEDEVTVVQDEIW